MSKKKNRESGRAGAELTAQGAGAGSPAVVAPVRAWVPVTLIALAALASLLALFQWMELVVIRAGGAAVCGVSETVDCQRVWETPFASVIHERLGMPVAGLGLVWGLAALGLSLAWAHRLLSGREGGVQAAALKLTSFVGLLSIVVFASVSFRASALCLTCLGTYVVVGAFALVALRSVPGGPVPSGSALQKGALWAAGFAAVAYFALLWPGTMTAKAGGSGALGPAQKVTAPIGVAGQTGATAATGATGTTGSVATSTDAGASAAPATKRPLSAAEEEAVRYLTRLDPPERQLVSNFLALHKVAPSAEPPLPTPRKLHGPATAPVKLVDWIEIRCGHCRKLNETLHELEENLPAGTIAVESRYFPLARECNPYVQRPDPSGVSCYAAKALICLEQSKDFRRIRNELFEEQQSLETIGSVLEIAKKSDLGQAKLEQCVADPETAKKLSEDVAYAMKYDPQGTPVLTINGRSVTPFGPLLFPLVLTAADANSPAFDVLPAPNLAAMDDHAGHGH